MAEIIKKKISELPEETLVSGMHTIVVTPTGSSAKTNLDKVIENETAISEEKDRAGQAEQAIANNLNKHVNSSTAHKSLFDKKVNIANIVNDLISLDTDKPASANTVRVLKELIDTINETLQSNDITLDTIQKIVDYIKNNRSDLDNHIESNTAHKAIFDTKVNVSDIINNLTSTDTNKPASANTVKTLKGLIDTINQTLASDDVNLNTVQKIVDYIKENRDALENLDIEDISGLSDALELAAGASVTIEQAPIPVSMDTTETQVTFNTLHQSTNSDIIEADDTNNVITIKRAGRYQLLSSINLTNTNSQDVVATFKVYDVTTEDLISSRSATIERQTANAPVPSVVVSLDVQVVPISYKFTNIASAGGIAINSTEIMVGTAAGGIGIVEHSNTLNRDKPNAHPIGAITGLEEKLKILTDVTTGIDWYGYEYDKTVSDPAVTRIGNLELHRTLPLQSKMVGCLIDGTTGAVNEYLDPNNWEASTLDGSEGQVMVEIPNIYYKFETVGNIYRAKFSEKPLPGFSLWPKNYVSAYEASLDRENLKLSSVMNNTANYRGGNNNADWDGSYRSLLGRPATSMSRINFTNYARNRGTTTEWNQYLYIQHKAIYHMFILEYATRNSQAAFTSELTSEGYKQGGLGDGVTTVNSTIWSDKFSYNPFVPCGTSNSLGNYSGEVDHITYDENSDILWTQKVNRYRGIELPFGHIWKWTEGLNIERTLTESKVYTSNNPENFSGTGYTDYDLIGIEASENGYVKEIIAGTTGDIMPSEVGGGSTTYFCDYHYTGTSAGLRGARFGGGAYYGSGAGFACAGSDGSPANATARVGSRLCFLPKI